MPSIKFESYKDKIVKSIQSKIDKGFVMRDPEGFVLIEGFVNITTQNEVSGSFVLGGPTIPTVAIVGKSSGLVYTFALKVLLPEIEL